MPHRSRDRRGGYEREWVGRERTDDRRRRRLPGAFDDESEDVEEEDPDDDEDDVFDDRRRPRHIQREHHRSRNRQYRQVRDDDDEEDEDGEDASEGDVILVESRPNFARPPNARSSPNTTPQRVSDRRSRYNQKAKESPATSPVKKKDRERDREGYRRRRESTAEEDNYYSGGAAGARLRDRRGNDTRRERERDRTRDGQRHKRSRSRMGPGSGDSRRDKHASADSANSATQLLSADALARLDAFNHKRDATTKKKDDKKEKEREKERAREKEREREREKRKRKKKQYELEKAAAAREKRATGWDSASDILGKKLRIKNKNRSGNNEEVLVVKDREGKKRRLVSGALLEEGRSPELRTRGGGHQRREKWEKRGIGGGGGDDDDDEDGGNGKWFHNWSRKKKMWTFIAVLVLLLAIIIPVAVVISNKSGGDEDSGSGSEASDSDSPSNKELDDIDRDSIPSDAKGTYLDPFSWYDTTDFNVTYTDETVGDLPIMGLESSWDDSAKPNDKVPALNKKFSYGKQPIRGVNLGGWLSIEPFITPSLFNNYSAKEKIVDEYTLLKKLGNSGKKIMEKHYANFVTEKTFKEIRDAGFDHVRIPYSYWAVTTYDGDPYEAKLSWRYLLRGLEYCRKYGLRVKLDLHGGPGSQNGWNHSGRQGNMGWLNGKDGDKWGDRAHDLHDQLSKFFAQPRYKNVVALYGLMNEPMMLKMEIEPILKWITKVSDTIEKNGMKQYIVFADGFLKLSKWKTMLQDTGHDMIIDTHQYTIFNSDLIGMDHAKKVDFVCDSWTDLIEGSSSGKKGWGPTICGEWSQADTDCAQYLNNVNVGTRWTGTMDDPDAKATVLSPMCPAEKKGAKSDKKCNCDNANADPSDYSDSYKKFLRTYAEAQIYAFEKGWGWFYWTWDTEEAVQWSWKKGVEAGILPSKAYEPEFKCGDVPDFGDLPEYY